MNFNRLLIVFSIVTVAALSFQAVSNDENPAPPAEDGINWMTIEEVAKKSRKKPKKVFIDVYTDWCGWCKVMDQKTFTDPYIIEYINANYYAVKFNAEQKEEIKFKGKDYKFVPSGKKGYNEFAVHLTNGRLSYPTVVVLDESLDVLQPIPGYRKPPELDMILKYYGGDHHKKTDYETFQRNYTSPFDN